MSAWANIQVRPYGYGDTTTIPGEPEIVGSAGDRQRGTGQRLSPLVDSLFLDSSARDILAYIRTITFANLYGNTFDAVLSRLRGRPAPDSHFLEEISVLLLTIALMPIGLLAMIVHRIAALLQPDRAASAS